MPALLEQIAPVHTMSAQASLPPALNLRRVPLAWHTPDAPATMRTGRLFSLEQRRRLRGVHPRLTRPSPLLTYVAGIIAPPLSSPVASLAHLRGAEAIATIGEIDLRQPQPVLRIVAHLRQRDDAAHGVMNALLHNLGHAWGCQRILIGGPRLVPDDALPLTASAVDLTSAERAHLTLSLLRAIGASRVSVYAPNADEANSAFWAEIVRAEARIMIPTTRTITPHVPHIDPLDYRGYITSLALAVEAAASVLHPAQGRLLDRIPA